MPDLDLGDLDGFLDGKTITFAVHGKKYTVPEADGDRFLRLQRLGVALNAADQTEFNKLTEEEFSRLSLGGVYDDLIKAAATGSEIERATYAVFFWHIGVGSEMVRAAFQGGGAGGKAKRPPTKKAARTTRGAAATTTRPRASGSGARSPRK